MLYAICLAICMYDRKLVIRLRYWYLSSTVTDINNEMTYYFIHTTRYNIDSLIIKELYKRYNNCSLLIMITSCVLKKWVRIITSTMTSQTLYFADNHFTDSIISPTGHFIDNHFIDNHFTDNHFADNWFHRQPFRRHSFHRQSFHRQSFHRQVISPTVISSTGSFHWQVILPTVISPTMILLYVNLE